MTRGGGDAQGRLWRRLASPVSPGVQETKQWLREVSGKMSGQRVDWRRRQLSGCPDDREEGRGEQGDRSPVNPGWQPG